MPLSRRQFIKRTGVLAAGSFFGPSFLRPGFLRNPFLQKALADVIGDRYFIVLFLDGGNDGLNTVTPYDNADGTLRTDYQAARNAGGGGIQLPYSSLLVPDYPASPMIDPNTNAQLGFHPGLAGLNALYEEGKVAVIQGCGYPDYNLSHEIASSIWESGDPFGSVAAGTGWMGRYLATQYAGNNIPGVCIRDSVAGEYATNATSVLAIRRLVNFGFPFDEDYESDDVSKRACFNSLYSAAAGSAQSALQLLGSSGLATMVSADAYPPLHALYNATRQSWADQYTDDLGTSTARSFLEISKIIHGIVSGAPNVSARFFELANGGYDTHSDQGADATDGSHYELHKEVGDALKLFYDDLANMQPGLENKVCTLIWSEFSRRIFQNENGTDHGSQGPMFVIGGAVNGGVYGNHPNIVEGALDDDGNTPYTQAGDFRSTDMRDVYGTIMKHWLNLPDPSPIFPVDAGDPADYWTVADFDMGFLP